MKTTLLGGVLLCIGVASCHILSKPKDTFHYLRPIPTESDIDKMDNRLERLYFMSLGHFTNQAQADTTSNPLLKAQEIINVPIWRKQRVGEYWGVISWYPADYIETPLAQFAYKISKRDRDTFTLETFKMPDAMLGTGWAAENPYSAFKPQDLIKSGCIHYIVPQTDGKFLVYLPEGQKPCVSTVRIKGMETLFEFHTQIDYSQQISHLKFYDTKGNVLMSYKDGNHFKRVAVPKYLDILYKEK